VKSPVPCGSCGLVYFHYGKVIIQKILETKFPVNEFDLDILWMAQYEAFVQEIDARDNGVQPSQEDSLFRYQTTISDRILMLHPPRKSDDKTSDEHFAQAVEFIGNEFEFFLFYTYKKVSGLLPASP
jgi:uncharacterized UPF0160 family protein